MKYQVVLIDNFFEQTEDEQLQKVVSNIWQIKNVGYSQKHNKPYFPLSADDFYGVHVALCDKDLTPIMAFKFTPYSTCQQYNNTIFPLYEHTKETFNDFEKKKVEAFVNGVISSGRDLSYSGGWCVNPFFKGEGNSREFMDIYTAIHYLAHKELGLVYCTGVGLKELRTLDYFVNVIGAVPFIDKLYNFSTCSHVSGKLLYADMVNPPKNVLELADKYGSLWDARLSFLPTKKTTKEAA